MCQESNVFGVIVSFVLALSLLLWLPGMNALENAQPPGGTQTLNTK